MAVEPTTPRRARMRTAAVALVPWVLALVLVRGVALPERCPPLDATSARASAEEAVGWLVRAQQPDGRFLYRYRFGSGEEVDAIHTTRHAGVVMSLYQAHAAGIDGALEAADAGTSWALDHLVRHDGRAAFTVGSGRVPIGPTALLTAGLALRERTTGSAGPAEGLLDDFGRFLVAQVEDDGTVLAEWDPATGRPVPDVTSTFFTGEATWALTLLATRDPAGPWAGAAERALHYVATRRDRAEDRFPPTSDHWAAYALAEWHASHGLDAALTAYARRLGGIFSVQARFESQRTGEGAVLLLRGHQALGAGLGTVGEGLGSLRALASTDDGPLRDDASAIDARLACVAGMLADRQIGEVEAAASPEPSFARGAWFTGDVTQKDDQQHALSALLFASTALPAGDTIDTRGPSSQAAGPWWWLAVVVAAAANPWARRERERTVTVAAAAAALGVVIVGPWIVEVMDVTVPTAVIAAGLVVALAGAVDIVRPAAARPAGFVLLAALAADAGRLDALLALAGAALLVAAVRVRGPWLPRLAGALAVAGGLDLVYRGIFAI